MRAPQTVVDDLAFPECLRWRDGALWFSDQHDGVVRRYTPGGSADVVVRVPGDPAGIGWWSDGTMVVASMHERRLYVVEPGSDEPRVLADLAELHPGLTNDLVVGPDDRAYVGNIGFDFYGGEEPVTTNVAMVDRRGNVTRAAAELLVPNGSVMTSRGTVIIAESFAGKLTEFDVAPDGQLVDRRTFADLGDSIPDGLCIDEDDTVWVALIGEHLVRRTNADEILDEVPVGEPEVIDCQLGLTATGQRALYLATSRHLDPSETIEARSGCIQVVVLDDGS